MQWKVTCWKHRISSCDTDSGRQPGPAEVMSAVSRDVGFSVGKVEQSLEGSNVDGSLKRRQMASC